MRIEYSLKEKDYIQFNINAAMKLETYKKNIKLMKIWNRLMMIVVPINLILLILDYSIFNLSLFIGSIVVFLATFFYPKLTAYFIGKNAERIAVENMESILGEVILEIDDEWISTIRKNSEKKFKINSIKMIEDTSDYLFVYVNEIEAIIIPNDIFESKEKKETFIQLIRS